jgi:Mg-chelatase subunit ChlD
MTQTPTNNHPATSGRTTSRAAGGSRKGGRTVHFYVLLDRSGSMESMRSDVIGGYNNFLREQRQEHGRARITLVQFDSQDPQETLLDAAPISGASDLTADTFVPRGGTPLLDATASLVERARGRRSTRRALGRREEEIVFVTVTDGEENQSTRYTLEHVRRLVEAGRAEGWNFVYLGAGLDAYGDAARLGYDPASTQAWKADGEGAQAMWGSVSRAAAQLRRDVAAGVAFNKAEYFRGVKEAEES